MERITPLDLESARFPIVKKGYDAGAVHAILKTAAAELDAVRQEVQFVRKQHENELKELELFRKKESALAEALILAQKSAEETRSSAHKEAELIIAHAKRQAEDARRTVQDESAELERQIDQLKQDKRNFEMRFRSMLEDYLATLKDMQQVRVEENSAAVL
jgi:cell division initiation protein